MDPANRCNGAYAYQNPLYHQHKETAPADRNYHYDRGLSNSLDHPIPTGTVPNPLYTDSSDILCQKTTKTNYSESTDSKYRNYDYDHGCLNSLDSKADCGVENVKPKLVGEKSDVKHNNASDKLDYQFFNWTDFS